MVDTGAYFCYIAENLCKFLHLEIEQYDCDVLVGNKQKLRVVGKSYNHFTITDDQYLIVCTVVETLSYPIILGWEGFIVPYQGVIDSTTL